MNQVTALTERDIQDYLFCPVLFYVKKCKAFLLPRMDQRLQKNMARLGGTSLDLPEMAVNQALQLYAENKPEITLVEALGRTWLSWLEGASAPQGLWRQLLVYADVRNNMILRPFFRGEILTRKRARYLEPRSSARYRSMMVNNKLTHLAENIDRQVLQGLHVVAGELPGVGAYPVAEAFADSLLMVEGYMLQRSGDLRIVNKQVPVNMHNQAKVLFQVQLAYQQNEQWVIEVLDCQPGFVFPKKTVYRDMRVLLAGIALDSLPGGRGGSVVYRHLMSGEKVLCRDLRTSHAVLIVESILRSIENDIYLPAFLRGGGEACRTCPACEVCSGSGDILEWLLPGLQDAGLRLKTMAGMLDEKVVDKAVLGELLKVCEQGRAVPTALLRLLAE